MTFTTRGCYWCYNSSSTFYNITFHYYSEASSLTPFLLRYRLRPSYRKEFSSVLFLLDSFLMFCQAGKVLFKKASLPAFSSSFSQLHSLQESEMEPAQLNTFYSLLKLFFSRVFLRIFLTQKNSQINFTRWWHWPQPRNFQFTDFTHLKKIRSSWHCLSDEKFWFLTFLFPVLFSGQKL